MLQVIWGGDYHYATDWFYQESKSGGLAPAGLVPIAALTSLSQTRKQPSSRNGKKSCEFVQEGQDDRYWLTSGKDITDFTTD